MRIERLETPALIVDEQILKQNMAEMAKLLDGKNIKLRPHYKSHKCAEIARWQIEAGAVGMTCAKLSEAIDLSDAGIENILIANQIVQPSKISRLAQLALDCTLTVCVDDVDNVKALSEAAKNAGSTIHCLVEYEIGMNRCGVTTHEEVLSLAKAISEAKGLVFDGIQAYAGHMSHEISEEERAAVTAKNSADLRALLKELEDTGTPAATLSGGSTGTSVIKTGEDLYTELQAGSYLFMDATYRDLDLPFKNSLFILSTVVSTKPGLTVIDSGVKSCGVDQGMPAVCGFEAESITASEEHFQLKNPNKDLALGDKVLLVPGHCCSTVNLYDKIYVVNDGKVVNRIAVTARGASK